LDLFVACAAVKVQNYILKVSVATPINVLWIKEKLLLANMVLDVGAKCPTSVFSCAKSKSSAVFMAFLSAVYAAF
jgi:hypothetical protein